MTTPTWEGWIARHGELFGLLNTSARAMLASLSHAFHERGYGPAHLFRASEWLIDNEPPTYPTEHLAALKRALAALEGADRAAIQAPAGEACGLCGDPACGFVLVPNTDTIAFTRRLTCVVLCRCPLGRYRRSTLGPIRYRGSEATVQTIEDYEQEMPDWRDVLASWRREQKAELEAMLHARKVGGAFHRAVSQVVRQAKGESNG